MMSDCFVCECRNFKLKKLFFFDHKTIEIVESAAMLTADSPWVHLSNGLPCLIGSRPLIKICTSLASNARLLPKAPTLEGREAQGGSTYKTISSVLP